MAPARTQDESTFVLSCPVTPLYLNFRENKLFSITGILFKEWLLVMKDRILKIGLVVNIWVNCGKGEDINYQKFY